MKIRELEVNQIVTITLVVKSASARETKAKKPYLQLEFFDGTDTINGNYWNWGGTNIPQANAVLDVKAQVTEWQGTKQLNVKGMTTNTEVPLSDFAPSSGADIGETYKDAYALMSDVKDEFLRDLAMSALEELQSKWLIVPGAKGIHHAYTAGTLIHSYSVACIAKAIAEHTPGANVDLCTVGGMLHDLGKLYTYMLNGVTIDMTDEGMLYDHIFMGAEFIGNYADSHYTMDETCMLKLEMLRHIILAHHGKLEYGSVTVPLSIEAHIVYHADAIDAAAEQVREQSAKLGNVKWTDRIWALENRPHLTTQYVSEVMKLHTAEEE
jgi:3'-5' exoribonuclease